MILHLTLLDETWQKEHKISKFTPQSDCMAFKIVLSALSDQFLPVYFIPKEITFLINHHLVRCM